MRLTADEKAEVIRLVIQLTGASHLTTSDAFIGNDINIRLAGTSSLHGLNISASNLELECSGVSSLSLTLHTTGNLTASAFGSTNVDIFATGVTNSTIIALGAAKMQIKGDGIGGNWTSNGSAQITGDEFTLRELTLTASGASSVRVNVSESLTTRTSGSSSVRYRGQPTYVYSTSGASSVHALTDVQ